MFFLAMPLTVFLDLGQLKRKSLYIIFGTVGYCVVFFIVLVLPTKIELDIFLGLFGGAAGLIHACFMDSNN